jgi:ferredoxin
MTYHTVTIEDTGEQYRCHESRTVLEGMESLGRKGIPAGCRGGGCGVCKVEVIEGRFTRRAMSREHVSAEEEARGVVLACRIRPLDALHLRVVGKLKKNVCRDVDQPGA